MLRLSSAVLATTVLLATAANSESDEPGRGWYKGNTHTHSFWSDGDDFPEMIVDWYHQHDYDFLAISDHNILGIGEKWIDFDYAVDYSATPDVLDKYRERFPDDWVETREHEGKTQIRLKTLEEYRVLFEETNRFLLIQAEEISDRFEEKPIHINAVNLEALIPPQGGSSVRETIRNNLRAVKEQQEETGQPILTHLNHPNFHFAITPEDLAHVVEEDFFEVYNGHSSINHEGDAYRPGDERMWDIANTIRLGELGARPLYGVATDDAHNYHGDNRSVPGRGWIMVRADKLSTEAIIEAMEHGDFYASSGVTLTDVSFDPKTRTIAIEIEPVEDETYTTHFIGTQIDYDRTTEPAVDGNGELMPGRMHYSGDVGKTLASVEGTTATYQLEGNELYVRATVISSAAPTKPVYENQKKKAWIQPIGWDKHVQD